MAAAAFDSSLHLNDNKHHLLLAATGSVASIKIPNIISALSTHRNLSIRLMLTPSSAHFFSGQTAEQPTLATIAALPNVDGVYQDADEWDPAWTRGAKILHIELRRWADVMVVAPLSANSLAKMVGGVADGLVLSVLRAWDASGLLDVPHIVDGRGEERVVERGADGVPTTWTAGAKRVVVAAAMNTAMWAHPVTKTQLGTLEGEWNVANGGWVEVLRPVEKVLACGDTGTGAMKPWTDIVRRIEEILGLDHNSSDT
jgi:phosphopantothenoylcysteine decarboxylase